jgi:hypothetical protein
MNGATFLVSKFVILLIVENSLSSSSDEGRVIEFVDFTEVKEVVEVMTLITEDVSFDVTEVLLADFFGREGFVGESNE